jgi:hypothetical protein
MARAASLKEVDMAFNNVGPLTFLAPGQTAFWFYTYGPDHGTQFASADIKTPNLGAVHLADDQRKRKDNNGDATYFVAIHNQGVGGCFHNLQGGGMS